MLEKRNNVWNLHSDCCVSPVLVVTLTSALVRTVHCQQVGNKEQSLLFYLVSLREHGKTLGYYFTFNIIYYYYYYFHLYNSS